MKEWSEPPSLEELNKSYGELFAADLSTNFASALIDAIKHEYDAPFHTKYLTANLPLLIARFIGGSDIKNIDKRPYKKLCDSLHDMSPVKHDLLQAYVENKCDGDIEPCTRASEVSLHFSENVGDYGLVRNLVRGHARAAFSCISINNNCKHMFDMCDIADQLFSITGAITE